MTSLQPGRNAVRVTALAVALLVELGSPRAAPLEPGEQRGRAFARANCATCHAIGPTGESPIKIAPPFRTLHERYPVESLAESFAEGIVTRIRPCRASGWTATRSTTSSAT